MIIAIYVYNFLTHAITIIQTNEYSDQKAIVSHPQGCAYELCDWDQ
jgi:hypothetical protein